MIFRNLVRLLAAATLLSMTTLTTGCGGLLGGGKPAALYQFGEVAMDQAGDPPTPIGRPLVLLYAGSSFERQIRGDRILTTTGNQAAYIAKTRWTAPARELFDSVALRRLQGISPQITVVRIGQRPVVDYLLSIDVRRFEADYSRHSEAPDAVIDARAQLVRVADRAIVGDWVVVQREPAQENRVTAIVAAFDRATATTTTRFASLTRQALAGR